GLADVRLLDARASGRLHPPGLPGDGAPARKPTGSGPGRCAAARTFARRPERAMGGETPPGRCGQARGSSATFACAFSFHGLTGKRRASLARANDVRMKPRHIAASSACAMLALPSFVFIGASIKVMRTIEVAPQHQEAIFVQLDS